MLKISSALRIFWKEIQAVFAISQFLISQPFQFLVKFTLSFLENSRFSRILSTKKKNLKQKRKIYVKPYIFQWLPLTFVIFVIFCSLNFSRIEKLSRQFSRREITRRNTRCRLQTKILWKDFNIGLKVKY